MIKTVFNAINSETGLRVSFNRIPAGSTDPRDDQYRASWYSSCGKSSYVVVYDVDTIDRQIESGYYTDLVVVEKIEMPKNFLFTVPDGIFDITYAAETVTDKYGLTSVTVRWFHPGQGYQSLTYNEDKAQSFISKGEWKVVQPEFKNQCLDIDVPEYLDANLTIDSSLLDQYTIAPPKLVHQFTLEQIQEFSKETGYEVTVDAEFVSFIYDGKVDFVVKTDVEVIEVAQAIRTLAKYTDKG